MIWAGPEDAHTLFLLSTFRKMLLSPAEWMLLSPNHGQLGCHSKSKLQERL